MQKKMLNFFLASACFTPLGPGKLSIPRRDPPDTLQMAMLLVTRLVTGLALDRAALPAMRSTTRALRLHSPMLQARSPVTVAAGAVEVTTAVPLTTATFAASDATASEWSGDMIIVPLWQADKGERPTLGPSAQALDDKLAGAVSDLIADAEFEGKAGASAVVALPRGQAVRKVAIVGLGNQTDCKVSGALSG